MSDSVSLAARVLRSGLFSLEVFVNALGDEREDELRALLVLRQARRDGYAGAIEAMRLLAPVVLERHGGDDGVSFGATGAVVDVRRDPDAEPVWISGRRSANGAACENCGRTHFGATPEVFVAIGGLVRCGACASSFRDGLRALDVTIRGDRGELVRAWNGGPTCAEQCESFDGRPCALVSGHAGAHRCGPSLGLSAPSPLGLTGDESRSVEAPLSTGTDRATAENTAESHDTQR